MSKKTFRVAFCGCGAIAAAHAKELARISGVELVAFWNRTPERARAMQEELGGDYWCKDFQRIADDESIDAVYINTMHNDRLRLVKAMADSGKAIFSEKPLAHSPAALRELHACLRDREVFFWSGYKIRFHTLVRKAQELLPDATLLNVHVMDETWPEGGLNDPDVGGGNVMAQGVYATETIRLLAQSRPVSVSATLRCARHGGVSPDTLCAVFEFESGAIGSIAVGDAGTAPQPISKFLATASGGNKSLTIFDRFQRLEFLDGNTDTREEETMEEDGFYRQSVAFFRDLAAGNPPESNFVEGAIPSIMIYAAIESAELGRRLAIDIDSFLDLNSQSASKR